MTFELQRVLTQLNELKQDYESLKKTMKELERTSLRMKNDASPFDDWIFAEKVMKLLNVSKTTMYRYVDDGIFPASKIGGRLIFKVEDIIKVLNNNYKHISNKE